jgi:hypothetical protein
MPDEPDVNGSDNSTEETPDHQIPTEPVVIPPNETFEQRRQREERDAFLKRNAEAVAARREILLRNAGIDDTEGIDLEEALRRCCG